MPASTSVYTPPTPQEVEEIVREAVERIVAEVDPLRVILFGSTARGDRRPDSDLDFLVVMPRLADAQEKRAVKDQLQEAVRGLGLWVDVHVTDAEDLVRRGDLIGPILRPALREGKLMHPWSDEEAAREAANWLEFAVADLRAAHLLQREQMSPRLVCFHAQQAAEKALKAVLIRDQVDFPRTHDLKALQELVVGLKPPEQLTLDASWLTKYSVSTRYPGEKETPPEAAERALTVADQAVSMARSRLGG